MEGDLIGVLDHAQADQGRFGVADTETGKVATSSSAGLPSPSLFALPARFTGSPAHGDAAASALRSAFDAGLQLVAVEDPVDAVDATSLGPGSQALAVPHHPGRIAGIEKQGVPTLGVRGVDQQGGVGFGAAGEIIEPRILTVAPQVVLVTAKQQQGHLAEETALNQGHRRSAATAVGGNGQGEAADQHGADGVGGRTESRTGVIPTTRQRRSGGPHGGRAWRGSENPAAGCRSTGPPRSR